MSEEKEEYNVVILSRQTITTYPKLGQAVETMLITYVAAGLPPHTIRMPVDGWVEGTEKTLLRASIEARLLKRPETYKV